MKGLERGNTSTVFPDDHQLAILGHELCNVLNGLLGMAELLGNSGLTAEQGRWLRAIVHSGKQMESLIRPGRFFRTANQTVCLPHPARVDGLELLEQVIISHTPAARVRKNRLFLVVHPGSAQALALRCLSGPAIARQPGGECHQVHPVR